MSNKCDCSAIKSLGPFGIFATWIESTKSHVQQSHSSIRSGHSLRLTFKMVFMGYDLKEKQKLVICITCSMSRWGNVWDNAAMESFFSSLKTERTARKVYRTRDQARANVFDYIERFYNPRRRHSTLDFLSPMAYEKRAMRA